MNDKTVIQTRDYAKIAENAIENVELSLVTSEDVLEWSHGEITKPETINYKTYKPEKGGLFDEVVFGPTTDFKCPICGKKYKKSNEGQTCSQTEECKLQNPEILPKSARRRRMGHIELASPVTHFWYFKIDHSMISKLLGLRTEKSGKVYSKSQIESIIYFKSHMVLDNGGLKELEKNEIIDINKAAVVYRNALREIQLKFAPGSDEYEDIQLSITELEETASSKIGKDYGIDFYELNEIIEEYSDAKISTGTRAMEYLLENVDLKGESKRIKQQINKINKELIGSKKVTTKVQQRAKLYKRLEVINSFIKSGQDPRSMLIYHLPVIPADLRPLVQIDGGRHSTTDVNELYRRIIIRNNRLKKWYELEAPILIIQNELRMLQEAVDALIDNGRKKPSPVLSKDNRPLKSIADSLTGKKGRFRQNLLGKRVDYSGRSVIVVGPDLKMHQAGVPRQMAARLFEPWIIKELIRDDVVSSLKAAKKMIEEQDSKIWPYVEKAIADKVVLLNRAPTLHRLSIQAFEPVLVRGKAIMLHPLVTTAFNADFDGDQMAIHVPISKEAIREARDLMLANKNILGPKDGDPIINPSQDVILGLYYLTMEKVKAKGEGHVFSSYDEMQKALFQNDIDIHARVAISTISAKKENLRNEKGYVISTVGKFILNRAFPNNFPFIFDKSKETLEWSNSKIKAKYISKPGESIIENIAKLEINEPLNKKDIAKIVRNVFDTYVSVLAKEDVASIIKKVDHSNYKDTVMDFASLKDYQGNALNTIHAQLLSSFVKVEFERIEKRLKLKNDELEEVTLNNDLRVELLEKVWFSYTNLSANTLDNIKDLGFEYSTRSGVTMSINDIIRSSVKKAEVTKGEDYVSDLKKMHQRGLITEDERYQLSIKKWDEVKKVVEKDLKDVAASKEHEYNPIFMMMKSGARGNISNFVQLAGLRGLMVNSKKTFKAWATNDVIVRTIVEVPVKSSFLEGLTAFEFYSSTHGARKGLTDIALNTANSGYLTRRLVDVAQNIVVREDNCGTDDGTKVREIVDTKTRTTIVELRERIIGRYTNEAIFDKTGKEIIAETKLIDENIADQIIKSGVKEVPIRTVLGCLTKNGVCKTCYGKDLATNRIVQIGEPVGIVAAQSIGEPGTQLTMRTFHTGGVAGVEDITGGFERLKQLIDATKETWEEKAVISKTKGVIEKITKKQDDDDFSIITVKPSHKDQENYTYEFKNSRNLRVKKGDEVYAGQKLVDGPIRLDELLEISGPTAVELYLLKEIQRIYRMTGIAISDKYIEIIIRQMFSKLIIEDAGDSDLFVGAIIDISQYREVNKKLLLANKRPVYGQVVIKGAKQTPLLSSSFLAAASYQETAKVLVHASIEGRKDELSGLKENIIVGHKIPAGTASNYEEKGKFDIKDSYEFFSEQT